jgi:hypothetical protein
VVGVLEIAIFVPNRATKVQTEAKTDQGKPTTRFHLATRVLEPKLGPPNRPWAKRPKIQRILTLFGLFPKVVRQTGDPKITFLANFYARLRKY